MLFRIVVAGLTAATLAGCSVGTGPATSKPVVNLSVAAGQPGATVAPDSITTGGHTLVLRTVELVLREVRLKRVEDEEAECSSSGSSSHGGSSSDGSDDDHDACEYFIAGPLFLDVPVGGAPERIVTIEVDSGSYRRVEFRIHKPESSGDQAFVAAHPDFGDISVRVTGSFDGKGFTYTSDVNAKQKVRLATPLVVADGGATDLTLVVDLKTWFVSGGALIDPATALKGGRNSSSVEGNIAKSFRLESKGYYGR